MAQFVKQLLAVSDGHGDDVAAGDDHVDQRARGAVVDSFEVAPFERPEQRPGQHRRSPHCVRCQFVIYGQMRSRRLMTVNPNHQLPMASAARTDRLSSEGSAWV